MRYLGVDYGSKRVGLALSDEAGTMGFPHAIVPTTSRLADELCALIEKEHVGAVVIGESRNLDGSDNKIAAGIVALAIELEGRGIPVYLESEAFTSAEARRQYESKGKTRKPHFVGPVDASAAALILTSYLSRTDHGERTHIN